MATSNQLLYKISARSCNEKRSGILDTIQTFEPINLDDSLSFELTTSENTNAMIGIHGYLCIAPKDLRQASATDQQLKLLFGLFNFKFGSTICQEVQRCLQLETNPKYIKTITFSLHSAKARSYTEWWCCALKDENHNAIYPNILSTMTATFS